ncbi:MAG: Beta-galactosidase C-terminal domain [Clostridiales bacterium]|nr:Beta-galactosidase C-terminal domain [Clostridiales bacterium]
MRQKEGKRYLFVLNFQPEAVRYILKKEAVHLYTGKKVQGEQMLDKYGTAVYEFRK